MTKRFKNPQMMLRFCMKCRRVFGCKDATKGKIVNDCWTCKFTYGCVAGVLIDNVPKNLARCATSGICDECRQHIH